MKKLLSVCALIMFPMVGVAETPDLRGLYSTHNTCDLSQEGAKFFLVANDGSIVTDEDECTINRVKQGPFLGTIAVKLVCHGEQAKERGFEVWKYGRYVRGGHGGIHVSPVTLSVSRMSSQSFYYKCPSSSYTNL